jgi:4a-hydroxytetrahydrobiopterin dehydratase
MKSSLSQKRIAALLPKLRGWKLQAGQLCKTYPFKDYYHTMAFVNAVAWIAHRQDHHPDLIVGYNRCQVCYSTHSVNGLSENDFICAAKVDALMQ